MQITYLRMLATALCVAWLEGNAQKNSIENLQLIEDRIEFIAENNDSENTDYSELHDVLLFYLEHPININKSSKEELMDFGLLSNEQINAILNHRNVFGLLLNIFELQVLDQFERSDFELIRPFITVKGGLDHSQITLSKILKNCAHEYFIMTSSTIEKQKGYTQPTKPDSQLNNLYIGDPYRVYTRYRIRFKQNLSLGIIGEKDAGEDFFGNYNSGFDFYSAHAFWKSKGTINKVAFGDYQLQFGQGLCIWSGLGFGKSSDMSTLKRNARGLSPYSSVDENNFFRGIALGGEINNFDWTLFASSKNIDANIVEADSNLTTSNSELTFSSFQRSGFHRTINEFEDKDAIKAKHFGANIKFEKDQLKISASILKSNFNASLQQNERSYNQFGFSGNQNLVVALDFDWNFQNFNFFAEVCRDINGDLAYVAGTLAAIDPKLSVAILQRFYPRDFNALSANPVMESSRPSNEKGIMLGMDYLPSKIWKLSAYFDRFEFPWLRFLVDAPSSGFDAFLQLKWQPHRRLASYFRYRFRKKAENINDPNARIDYPEDVIRTNLRWNLEYKISNSFRLKNRIEWIKRKEVFKTNESGILLLQDVIFQPLQSTVSIKIRYALFDTHSYESRIYAYENDLIYNYSIPAYYGQGVRYYALLRWKASKKLELWVRYAQSKFKDVESLLSGLNEIAGNRRSDIKMMIRLKL